MINKLKWCSCSWTCILTAVRVPHPQMEQLDPMLPLETLHQSQRHLRHRCPTLSLRRRIRRNLRLRTCKYLLEDRWMVTRSFSTSILQNLHHGQVPGQTFQKEFLKMLIMQLAQPSRSRTEIELQIHQIGGQVRTVMETFETDNPNQPSTTILRWHLQSTSISNVAINTDTACVYIQPSRQPLVDATARC